YTYSAGLTVSTAVSQRIKAEGRPAVNRWLDVLKTGGKLKPLDLINKAGVDMPTPEAIKEAVAYVGTLVDDLEKRSESIDEAQQNSLPSFCKQGLESVQSFLFFLKHAKAWRPVINVGQYFSRLLEESDAQSHHSIAINNINALTVRFA